MEDTSEILPQNQTQSPSPGGPSNVSSPSLPVRGAHHPRGRRTGRHRVKSDRAIISPLAAFQVYIPSSYPRSLREGKRGTRGCGATEGREREEGCNAPRGSSLLHPRSSFRVFLPFPLDAVETATAEGNKKKNREGRGWRRRRGKCVLARGVERGVGARIKGAERLEGAPNYDVTDRTRCDQVRRIQK